MNKQAKKYITTIAQEAIVVILDSHREKFFGSINRTRGTGKAEADINKAFLRAKYGRKTYPLPVEDWKNMGMIAV